MTAYNVVQCPIDNTLSALSRERGVAEMGKPARPRPDNAAPNQTEVCSGVRSMVDQRRGPCK